jgi:hypothetical protein
MLLDVNYRSSLVYIALMNIVVIEVVVPGGAVLRADAIKNLMRESPKCSHGSVRLHN